MKLECPICGEDVRIYSSRITDHLTTRYFAQCEGCDRSAGIHVPNRAIDKAEDSEDEEKLERRIKWELSYKMETQG